MFKVGNLFETNWSYVLSEQVVTCFVAAPLSIPIPCFSWDAKTSQRTRNPKTSKRVKSRSWGLGENKSKIQEIMYFRPIFDLFYPHPPSRNLLLTYFRPTLMFSGFSGPLGGLLLLKPMPRNTTRTEDNRPSTQGFVVNAEPICWDKGSCVLVLMFLVGERICPCAPSEARW